VRHELDRENLEGASFF